MSKQSPTDSQSATMPTGDNTPRTSSTMHLDQCLSWPKRMRGPVKDGVQRLVDDFVDRGMLFPLILDAKHRIICGTQRKAAAERLRDEQLDVFQRWFPGGQIKVEIKPYDADVEVIQAMTDMIAENFCRTQVSRDDVLALMEALSEMGYTLRRGNPGKNAKPMMPELMRVLMRSERWVRDMIKDPDERRSGSKKPRKLKRVSTVKEPSAEPSETTEDHPAADAVAPYSVARADEPQTGSDCRIENPPPTPLVMVAATAPQSSQTTPLPPSVPPTAVEAPQVQTRVKPLALARKSVADLEPSDLRRFSEWFTEYYNEQLAAES